MSSTRAVKSLLVVTLGASVIGCESKAGTGALIGGAGGALGGALVGHSMDKNDEKNERDRREYQQARDRQSYNNQYSSQQQLAGRVTKDDVITWTSRGTKEEIII